MGLRHDARYAAWNPPAKARRVSYKENYSHIVWRDLPEEPRAFLSKMTFSQFPCPMIIGDTMPDLQSMVDGKMYDSKSALRRSYKAAGVIEIGNDPARLRPRRRSKTDRREIKTALEKAEGRFNRGERA